MAGVVLALVLLICLYTDLRERKIYNVVVFPAIIFGLLYNFYSAGIDGALWAFKGFGLGLAVFFIPFALGGLGAGDVKLMGAIGALMGSQFVLLTAIAAALFGGLIAFGIMLFKGQIGNFVRNTMGTLSIFLGNKDIRSFDGLDKKEYSIGFPYGVPIALGVLVAYLV